MARADKETVRPKHRSTRPQDEPIFTNPTGMDFEKRRIILAPGTVKYSDLTSLLRDKIDTASLTEEELLGLAVSTLKKINLCLSKMSDLEIEEDDIWQIL